MFRLRLPESASKYGFLLRARRNPHFMIGLGIIVIYVLRGGSSGPTSRPTIPTSRIWPGSFEGPSLEHVLGNDELGRDILSRIMAGGRYTLGMSVAAASLGLAAGLVLGATSGYFGGRIDGVVMTADQRHGRVSGASDRHRDHQRARQRCIQSRSGDRAGGNPVVRASRSRVRAFDQKRAVRRGRRRRGVLHVAHHRAPHHSRTFSLPCSST